MLKKVNRLAKASDIAAAFTKGRTFFNQFFSIRVSLSQSKRFTVVVSTKVYKSAVSRNRLKRIIREYLRKNLNLYKNGFYLISAKPRTSKLPEKDIIPNFLDVCSRIK